LIECDVVELVESESSEQSYEDLTWLDRDLPPTDNMNNIVDVSMTNGMELSPIRDLVVLNQQSSIKKS
jgi:hypothetical protein